MVFLLLSLRDESSKTCKRRRDRHRTERADGGDAVSGVGYLGVGGGRFGSRETSVGNREKIAADRCSFSSCSRSSFTQDVRESV